MHPLECHLLLEVENLTSVRHALVDALLRVDLGARIKTDATTGAVDIEGWFRREDVIAATTRVNGRLKQIVERPLSPRAVASDRSW